MTKSHDTLYGNVPDKSPVVLLLIDVINDLDFSDSQELLRFALPMAKRLASLKERAKKHECAVIYVNDNFGRWRSDFKSQVQHCLNDDVPGRKLAELLCPAEDDYFVLKPAHSGFYSTTLEILLKHLEAHTLILTGIATNLCVLFTANDAFLRGYHVCVPRDCVAANSERLSRDCLEQMRTSLKAEVHDSGALPWAKWKRTKPSHDG
ncbi:MAG TPA: isochorismatase family cysteine hydrolase [Pirellulales bacterium]|jgi:nicotinamidase-related amidase